MRVWCVVFVAVSLALAACSDQADPPPPGDVPVLGGFDALPKQLVTVAFTPTPTPVMAGGGDAVSVAIATPTSGPPRPTATLTPYIGIFLGASTSESGEPAPTLAPLAVSGVGAASGVASGAVVDQPAAVSTCDLSPAGAFAAGYAAVQGRLGCPTSSGRVLAGMASQDFERGLMLWRGDTGQIYALADSGQLWQAADNWHEGLPADDPAITVPPNHLQPVRGFGMLWRAEAAIREALGWGVRAEALYDATWQDFERGAMITAHDGNIFALYPAEGRHSGPLAR